MPEKISINRLTNANVYLNGTSQLGKAEDVTLPKLKFIMAEHKALGMFGKAEFPSGADKLEAKIKWNSFYADVYKKMANPFQPNQFQIRGSMESYTSQGRTAQVPVVVHMTAASKDLDAGNFKQHDNAEFETNFAVTYLKIVVNGEEIVEYDVLANIYKAEGKDLLAEYRQNIGG